MTLAVLFAVFRIGVIGADTYHSVAFTKYLNGPKAKPEYAGFRVTAVYKGGSEDIESSMSLLKANVPQLEKLGVEFVDSVDEVLDKCDAVLLETNDGRRHLEQAEKCFVAGKRVFIDKPLAHDLKDSVAIVEMAKKYNASFFTSSAIRYVKAIRGIRERGVKVRGMDCWTCFNYEASHDRWYWYGIHAVDPLFAMLGTGCESVVSYSGADGEVAIGKWKDGRFGIARGLSTAKEGAPYGGVVFTEAGQVDMGTYEGYADELSEIISFFKTGKTPVSPEESLEVMAYMTAARISADRGGVSVKIKDVLAEASRQACER